MYEKVRSDLYYYYYRRRSKVMEKLQQLKSKYNDGYRCIYSEKDDQNGMTLHLKNFREEKIDTFKAKGDMEIGQIEDFLQEIEARKKKYGHDCYDL